MATGVRSYWAFWIGGAARPPITRTSTHATSTWLRASATRAHSTTAIVRATFVVTQSTDVQLILTDTARTHSIDTFRSRTTAVGHSTTVLLRMVPIRAHTTNVSLQTVRTRMYLTDARLRGIRAAIHSTSTILRLSPIRAHSTASRMRKTVTRTHATDVARTLTAVRTHATNAFIGRPGQVVQRADTYLASRTFSSRSYSERIGTRLMDVGGDRQQGGTLHPIGFMLHDLVGGPALGRTPMVRLAKDGGTTWVDAQGAVIELGYGNYTLAGHPADRDTIGELKLHIEALGCRPVDLTVAIMAADPYAEVALAAVERTAIADMVLTRSWIAVVGAASRSALMALRHLRNLRWLDAANLMLVRDEAGGPAWKGRAAGDAGGRPILGVDPD